MWAAGEQLRQQVRAVRAELEPPGSADRHVGDGRASGRVPEPDAVASDEARRRPSGLKSTACGPQFVRPRRSVAHHAVVQRAALPAVGQLPEPEAGPASRNATCRSSGRSRDQSAR